MTQRIRVVAGLAISADNKVMIGRRPLDKKRPGMWEFPGGKVEQAEGDGKALAREWTEEMKITPKVGRRLARVSFDLESPVVISLYHVILGDLKPEITEDVIDIEWVDLQFAIEYRACTPSTYLFYPHVKVFLRQLEQRAPR